MKNPDEHVLVVSRSLFDQIGAFQGLCAEPDRYLGEFFEPQNNYFLSRASAEEDPSHKQIIPYAIFHHQGRFLHYVRGGGSGEQRLASKGSIGIGGHINSDDELQASLSDDTYSVGVSREIDEELNIVGGHSHKIVALINDDSNDVGAVHLGVVHLVELETDQVTPNEADIAELKFLTVDELRARRDQLETWSQICVDNLSDILATARSLG